MITNEDFRKRLKAGMVVRADSDVVKERRNRRAVIIQVTDYHVTIEFLLFIDENGVERLPYRESFLVQDVGIKVLPE